MANYPSDLKYTKDHEWAKLEGENIRVGITAYAVEQLGDVTLVDLPVTGAPLKAHERFGDIESVKTVSELFTPVEGTLVEINTQLADKPELVNENPYEQGWMVILKPTNPKALDDLMDAQAYQAYVASLDH